MTPGVDRDAWWRLAVLVAFCASAACAAHAVAGGGAPGPGGAVVLALVLGALASATRRWTTRPPGLAAVALGGQYLAHVVLCLVTGPAAAPAGGSPMPGMDMPGMAHATHAAAPVTAPAGGWAQTADQLRCAMTGLVHMGPAMALAHAAGALICAVLVTAVTAGLARLGRRFARLLGAVLAVAENRLVARVDALVAGFAMAGAARCRTLRGPPALA